VAGMNPLQQAVQAILLDRQWHSIREIRKKVDHLITPERAAVAYRHSARTNRSKGGKEKSENPTPNETVEVGKTYVVYHMLRNMTKPSAQGHLAGMLEHTGYGINRAVRLYAWFCCNCGGKSFNSIMCEGCYKLVGDRRIEMLPDALIAGEANDTDS